MRPPTEDFELVAARRRWGARMLALWARPEPLAISAPPSQVSLTVIHVEAGAYLNVGGLIYDPRAIHRSRSSGTPTPRETPREQENRNEQLEVQRHDRLDHQRHLRDRRRAR